MAYDLAAFLETCRSAMRRWPETLLLGDVPATLAETEAWLKSARDARPLAMDETSKATLELFIVRAQMHIGQLKSDSLRCFYS
jgi:hypothetical protein